MAIWAIPLDPFLQTFFKDIMKMNGLLIVLMTLNLYSIAVILMIRLQFFVRFRVYFLILSIL